MQVTKSSDKPETVHDLPSTKQQADKDGDYLVEHSAARQSDISFRDEMKGERAFDLQSDILTGLSETGLRLNANIAPCLLDVQVVKCSPTC